MLTTLFYWFLPQKYKRSARIRNQEALMRRLEETAAEFDDDPLASMNWDSIPGAPCYSEEAAAYCKEHGGVFMNGLWFSSEELSGMQSSAS